MFIKKITLNNFRSFKGQHSFKFYPINLITGEIGAGKSSLSRIAITFALYGYSEVSISDLKTKKSEDSSWIELIIEDKKEIIVIKREIPSKLTVFQNGIEILPEALSTAKNEWIKKRFGDLEYFKKFRMIDMTEGINILDQGKTSLRKTLVAFHESILNKIRKNLLDKKSEYEKLNKDRLVFYKHYPSEKRLKFLELQSLEISKIYDSKNKLLNQIRNKLNSLMSSFGSYKNTISIYEKNKQKAESQPLCPTCNQKLPLESREAVIEKSNIEIKKASENIKDINEEINFHKESLKKFEKELFSIEKKKDRINYFKYRLEARMLQKEFIYTDKDILLINNCVKELDKFYSYYIIESVSQLEPIINNIISKIGFNLSFELSDKGEFDIKLTKDGNDYSYKELSSGQRLMISIAFKLALLLDKGDTGVILADEGFNNLDTQSVTDLYQMLQELPFQIISVLHRYFGEDNRNLNIIKLGESNAKSV